MKVVNQPIMKKDAMALVTGKPVFTNDKAPKECLIVKLLRSPYANAMIKSINTQFAMKVPVIEAILRVEYEVLPANLDPRKAMDKDTPLVHP